MHRLGQGIMLTLALACATGAQRTQQANNWAVLGQRSVTDRADHDAIVVTGARGDFRAVKFGVQRAAVDFHRVVVHYKNGRRQEIELRNTIPAGGESRAVDLNGTDRVISRVEFWYDARTMRGRQAVVRVFGMR